MLPSLRISTSSQHSSTSRSRCEERIRWRSPRSRISWMSWIMRSARGRIEAVGGLVEKQQLGTVRDGLRQLGGLLHAERVGAQRAVADFAQAHIEEGLVRALEGMLGRQAGEFGHQADEADAASWRR